MRLQRHRRRYAIKKHHRGNLITLASMIFFFVIFDGIIMYLSPIVMQKSGISLSMIGIIIGLSSVAGMTFDILLLRLLEKTTFKKIFFYMFLTASTVPFFLFGSNSITMYLLAMAAWGLYYNLYDIGTLDFIGLTTTTKQHTGSFGILRVFENLGYLIAPVFASFTLVIIGNSQIFPWWIYGLFLCAFVCYMFLYFSKMPKRNIARAENKTILGLFAEIKTWSKIGRLLFPILFLTLTINLLDDAIWTVGPLFSESLKNMSGLGSAFMIAYTLPPLLVGWFVGGFANRFGKKRIALIALLFGSVLLIGIGMMDSAPLLLTTIFCISFCFAFVWPTIGAAYADDITDRSRYHESIETIDDLFTNVGDTVGPILGGFSAQFLGIPHTFIVLGIFGTIAATVLFRYSPKNLVVPIR